MHNNNVITTMNINTQYLQYHNNNEIIIININKYHTTIITPGHYITTLKITTHTRM